MKTDQKAVLLVFFITLDFLFSSLVINKTIYSTNEQSNSTLRASGNYVEILTLDKVINDMRMPIADNTTEEQEQVVFEGMTLTQLAEKLDRTFANELKGKGYLVASYSLELGIDPYVAASIMMHETGCEWGCSYLLKQCNNVGGQKGYGCGDYIYYSTLDEGIMGVLYNVYVNYVSYGLTTPDLIGPKYAEDPNWRNAVNNYVNKFRNG